MIRQLMAFTLLLAFATQTFSKAFIVVDYVTNTKAFAKNCENKAKPKMHCNGKCQMMKKLQQEEKKDQQNPERKIDNNNEVLSSRSFFAVLPLQYVLIASISYKTFTKDGIIQMPRSIFHPPSA